MRDYNRAVEMDGDRAPSIVAAVREILTDVLGHEPADLTEYENYKRAGVWSAERRFVLKINAEADIRFESRALALARDVDVPTPEVVTVGVDPRLPGGRYLVMRFVEGEELGDDPGILRELGAILGRLHSVPMPHYGPLDDPHDSWFDWLNMYTERALEDCEDPALSEAHEAQDVLSSWRVELQSASIPRVMLHGDLQVTHALVADGHMAGLIDFDMACGGEPAWEFARFCTGVGSPEDDRRATKWLTHVLDGYGTTFDGRRIALYRLMAALSEIAFNASHSWWENVPGALEVFRQRLHVARR